MIEKYIKLLESFKQNQISKLIERIETKFFEILYSKHVSPRISPYFPLYEVDFMSHETQLEQGKFYIREQKGKIAYSVITPDGEQIKDAILEELNAPSSFKYELALMSDKVTPEKGFFYVRMIEKGLEYSVIDPKDNLTTGIIKKEQLRFNLDSDKSNFSPKDLEPFLPELLKVTSERNHTYPFALDAYRASVLSAASRVKHIQWVPFSNYSLDPDNISQIKKLLNALYFARLTFLDLEDINVRDIQNGYKDLKHLYSKTIDFAYEASYLATHLDVDLRDIFQEEFAILLPLLNQIQSSADSFAKEKKEVIENTLHSSKLAYKAGEVTGIAVDQMRPLGGDVDYNFLTQFSAVLPSYIDKLTLYIEQYSKQIKESEPKLNKEKLDELQNAALNLLNDIEHLKGNSVFISLKFLNYIYIIRNIITLSMSTLEQIGELSESSQDLIREQLGLLKYTILPTLFGLVDKIEVNTMLKPGTLSLPLMEKVKRLYEAIIYLPKKVVDFKAKGEELLVIEDSRFIELRLEMSYKRLDKSNKTLYKIQNVRDTCKQFFALLNNPLYKEFRLYQFPPEVKKELITHYKLIKPYMMKLDIDLNQIIIDRITGPEVEDWYSYLSKPLRYVTKQLPADHMVFVLAKEKELTNLITKDENSQLFHINLNKDLIESIQKQANPALFSYSEKISIFALDESIPLAIESDIKKKSKLTKTEFQHVQNAYNRFVRIINHQIAYKPKLYEPNLALITLDEKIKSDCHNLYKLFKPYISSFVSSELKDTAKTIERYLDDLFAKKSINSPLPTEFFLNLDKNIQGFFDQINFNWFDKKEFQTVLSAYSTFSQLLKKHIENKPENPDSNLLPCNLDEKVKDEIRALYKVFQPYLKLTVSPKFKESAQNFEKYINDILANNIDILDTPTTSLFLKLDRNILEFFTKWKDKSEHYYDFTKKQFLSEEESTALRVKREHDAQFHFKEIENEKTLQNHKQLTAEQALELYQWYKNKRDKFEVAQNAYTKFKQRVDLDKIITSGDMLLFANLDSKTKDECRNLYHILQSYFINAVPSEMKEDALKIDKFFVAIFSNKKINKKDIPSINTFLALDKHVLDFFDQTSIEWKCRTQIFMKLAEDNYVLENKESGLTNEPISSRVHFVIQHTDYSKRIHEFRQSLFALTKLFNQAMQKELTPKVYGVPFPEMEDSNKRLVQSKHVTALKEIFNSMYHLEGIALALEKLNNKSSKSIYVYYLLQAYGHLNEIIQLSKRLASDPHTGFIARDLFDKAQILYATFQEHSDAYQVGPEQVPYGPKSVQYNPLWYVLNAFYISPMHIRALTNTNYLTTEELNDLHFRAKKATLFIEGLINSSDSYFKLFLQTPNMIYLYQELTEKLNEFTSTSHDTVLLNLNKIKSKIITPMLLEADRWENRLGLVPGNLSGPLSQITNEFYKGLLHPLDLPSHNHISLACDKEPLLLRTNMTKGYIKNNSKFLKRIDKEFKEIEALYQSLEKYKEFTSRALPPSANLLNLTRRELQENYRKALPKIAKLKLDKKIDVPPSQYPEDHKFDVLCNSLLKEYDPHYTQVEGLIHASHHYYLGLKATAEMQLHSVEEKLDYLIKLEKIEEKEGLNFVQDYTAESFKKHLDVFCNRHIGLQYTDKEYRAKLHKYLLNFKNEIITKAKTTSDINLHIKKLLKEKISAFEKRHYAEYYHLDTVRVALAQFRIYFNQATVSLQNKESLFESEKTLNEKTKRINELDSIAENDYLSVKERLKQINSQVQDPNFSRIILAHKQTDTLSWTYLKICFLSLLEALHLYTPSRKKLLDKLDNAVQNPPEISELTKRFGLFASTSKAKNVEAKRYQPPNLPNIVPTN